MQKKLLTRFMKLIPLDAPRLNLKFYTKIFEYFLSDLKDYRTFRDALVRFPAYLINQDHLLDILKKQIEANPQLAEDELVLEILYLLHELNRDYQTAFHILVKIKSSKLFEFLKKVKLDFDLPTYLGKLLLIDSSQTVDYMLKKYGKV